ncbi:MAG TPA: ABC transporter ATP-binding protein [Thermoleophilaceae bacterium]
MLELHSVGKHYRSTDEVVRAVDDVSLTVHAGEFVALYGPSGSGKTSLLLLAASILSPDRGSVCFEGTDLRRFDDAEGARFRRREVGFIFQSFHLMAAASALDNAAVKLLGDGWSLVEARERAEPWLERVGLGARKDRRPGQLSTGERQRVAIARALVSEPRLILADEPTGNLDTQRGCEVLELLGELAHEHRACALLVTHDPEAMQFVDRVETLRDGRLLTPGRRLSSVAEVARPAAAPTFNEH